MIQNVPFFFAPREPAGRDRKIATEHQSPLLRVSDLAHRRPHSGCFTHGEHFYRYIYDNIKTETQAQPAHAHPGVESRDHEGAGRLRSSRRQPRLRRWHGGAAGEKLGGPQLQTCRKISAAVKSGRVKECVVGLGLAIRVVVLTWQLQTRAIIQVDGIPRPVPLPLTLALSRGGDALSLNHVRSGSLHSGCMANARRHFLLALVAAPLGKAHGLDPCSNGELIGALRRAGGGGQRGLLHREHFVGWRRRKISPMGDLDLRGAIPPPIGENSKKVDLLAIVVH